MRHLCKIAGIAVFAGLGVAAWTEPASAQGFDIRIGPRRPYYERPYEERRIYRPGRRMVCTTRWRERITPSGRVIRRPVQVCRRGGGFGY